MLMIKGYRWRLIKKSPLDVQHYHFRLMLIVFSPRGYNQIRSPCFDTDIKCNSLLINNWITKKSRFRITQENLTTYEFCYLFRSISLFKCKCLIYPCSQMFTFNFFQWSKVRKVHRTNEINSVFFSYLSSMSTIEAEPSIDTLDINQEIWIHVKNKTYTREGIIPLLYFRNLRQCKMIIKF